MKRNKQWYKAQERRHLRRQRIMLAVTATAFTAFVLIHFTLYTMSK